MLKNCHTCRGACPGKCTGWLSLAFVLFLVACAERVPSPMVTANGETLEGFCVGENDVIAAFRGIPFAAPPVGDLR